MQITDIFKGAHLKLYIPKLTMSPYKYLPVYILGPQQATGNWTTILGEPGFNGKEGN